MNLPASSVVSRLAPDTVAARGESAGRLRGAFGSRFFMALLAGLIWTGPAWWDHRFIYALPAWDVIVLLAWLLDFAGLPGPDEIEVRREWRRPLSLGESSAVTLRVWSASGRALSIDIEDDPPPRLNPSNTASHVQLTAGGGAGGSSAFFSYSVCPGARGDFDPGGAYVRYQSPLHFAERWAFANLKQRVRVYPSLRESEQSTLYLIRSRQIELEKRLKRRTGAGREFESLRDYRPGDEPRDICWTATARRGKPITRTYQVERSQSVIIVLDAGRLLLAKVRTSSTSDGQTGPVLNKLDHAINAALGLARVALYSGDAVGLTAYTRGIQARLPASRGTPHLRTIVESLAQVRGELVEADHARAAAYLLSTQRRRSLVVWLTELAETAATPDVIESALRLIPRHLVLFVAIAQPELRRLADERPRSVEDAYRYVAAQEMLQRREALLGRLRQQGALALEIEPEQLATGLVNQYLEIKERSLL